jgi:hypothetical protein
MKRKLLSGLLVSALALGFAVPANAQTYGAAYVTAITYQNLSSSTANITFSFYSEGSGTAINANYTLAANAAGSLNVGSLGSISAGFKGSTVMSSDQPVAATLVQLPPSSNASKTRPLSNGFSSGSQTVLIGTALKAYFSTSSIISVQNTDSVDNNFSVSFYAAGNTTPVLVDTTATNIPPGSAKYYDLGALAGLGSSFNGSAVVVATKSSGGSAGSAVATVMELSTATGGKAASAFEGAASGGTTVYMPSAMCQYSAAMNNSNFAVQNTSSSTTATVTTTFNPGGIQSTINVGPYAKASINACTAGNAAGWLGAATIVSTQPIIAIGKISGGGLSTAFLGATSGVAKTALPYVRWANVANYDNGTKQRTFITIQNVGTVTTTNPITVKYYDAAGTLVSTHTISTLLGPGAKATSNPNHQDPTNTTYEFGYGTPSGGSAIIESTGAQLAVVVRASSKIAGTSELAGEDYNGIAVSP